MSENGKEKLTYNQRKAIAALMVCPSVRSAALMCGLAERTLHRYIRKEHVKAELSRRQSETLAATSAALSGLSQRAIEALTQSLEVLTLQAQADVGDFIEIGEDSAGGWAVDLVSASDAKLLHLVKKLYSHKDGSDRLELHDSQNAAVALGRLAVSILEQRRKAVELDELSERVQRLENSIK